MIRLSPATNTSSRAGHDFNRMVLRLAGLYIIQQLTGIPQTMRYTYIKLQSVEIDCRGTDTFHAPQRMKIDFFQCLAGIELVCRTASRLNHSSGITEDHTCTG